MQAQETTFERHYSIDELASIWGVSDDFVRRLFLHEPGVVVFVLKPWLDRTLLFVFDDVANAMADKLERRHPHVFGDLKLDGVDGVLANWEKLNM